jgi:tetracycline repressor-like protein
VGTGGHRVAVAEVHAHAEPMSSGKGFHGFLHLPFGVPEFVEKIVSGGVDEAGRRTLQILITTWDLADGGPFAAGAVATTGLGKTVDLVYDNLIGPVFGPMLRAVGADEVSFRAGLCATQLVGLGVVRYVARLDPIRSMDAERLADAMAPTLQRYLVGDIS